MVEEQHSILVVGFGGKGVGDQIISTPLIRNLARNLPKAAIDYAASSALGVELMQHNPHIRDSFVLDMDYFRYGGRYPFSEKRAFLSRLRGKRYRTVYVLSSKFRHAMVAYLSGAPERIGYATYHRQCLLTKYAAEPLEKNLVDRFLDLLTLNGLTVHSNQIELFLADDEIKAAQELLASVFPGSNRPVVALAPFAADMRRTWGVEAFAQLALMCAAKGYPVLVLGGRGDMQHLQGSALADHPGIVSLVGKLGIRETAAVIKSSDLFVGNDSGLAHVAGAVGTTGIVIGYHVTKVWYPSAPFIRTIIRDPSCTSCDLDGCVGDTGDIPPCFRAISVQEVMEKLEIINPQYPRGYLERKN